VRRVGGTIPAPAFPWGKRERGICPPPPPPPPPEPLWSTIISDVAVDPAINPETNGHDLFVSVFWAALTPASLRGTFDHGTIYRVTRPNASPLTPEQEHRLRWFYPFLIADVPEQPCFKPILVGGLSRPSGLTFDASGNLTAVRLKVEQNQLVTAIRQIVLEVGWLECA
jgi:hypothetical protein